MSDNEAMDEISVRASDAERDLLVSQLRQDMVEGRLTVDEFTDRIEAAYGSRTRGELEALRHDLPAAVTGGALAVPARRRSTRWSIGIMGGSTRRGRWQVEGQTTAIAVMGGCHLDLREAEIEGPEVTINAVAFMGGINIFVPDDVVVEVSGISFMGGRNVGSAKTPPPPGAKVIRIRAFSMMGGLNVVTRPRPDALPAGDPLPPALPDGPVAKTGLPG
ncbi:MAG: hypothetical protein QOH02_1398 [Gaiellaceae bacterium]|nr:hypothetical protein [Gaiellaceae bacterium]